MSGAVSIEQRGAVHVAVLDNPPVNALGPEFIEQLSGAAEQLAAAQPGAVVLAGGERCFSAGLDLHVVPYLDAEGQRRMVGELNRMMSAWYALPFPVVAAVTGHAIAGGMILALCADVRVGTEASYGVTEVRVGVPYPNAAISIVRAELSPAVARQLALRGHLVDGAAALRLGLLDELVPREQVLPRALELAQELAALEPGVYARTKHELRGATISAMDHDTAHDPLLSGWLPEGVAERAAGML